jgi:hypothetical protein
LNFYYIYYFMIIVDWYMTITKKCHVNLIKNSKNGLDIIWGGGGDT